MSNGEVRERNETIRIGDFKRARMMRPNGRDEYFGLNTFASFIVAALQGAKTSAYRGRPASRGVMGKDQLFDLAESHFGRAFGRLDLTKIKARVGWVVRWKRTMAWAKVVLQRIHQNPRVIQRGQWIILCDPQTTHRAWINWAMVRPKRPKPPRLPKNGEFALPIKSKPRVLRAIGKAQVRRR